MMTHRQIGLSARQIRRLPRLDKLQRDA